MNKIEIFIYKHWGRTDFGRLSGEQFGIFAEIKDISIGDKML